MNMSICLGIGLGILGLGYDSSNEMQLNEMKLNNNRSFNLICNKVGFGGLIMDHMGAWIKRFMRNIGEASTIFACILCLNVFLKIV